MQKKMTMGEKQEQLEGESYSYLSDEDYLKDTSEPGVETHPDGGNKIFRSICSQTSLVWRTVSSVAGE